MAVKSRKESKHPGRLAFSFRRHLHERFIEMLLFMAALCSVLIMLAIVIMLVKESYVFSACVYLGFFDRYRMDAII